MKIVNNLPKLREDDTANSIITYESLDSTDVTEWTDVEVLESGEKHHSLFKKISSMFKNMRYLFKKLGTTDISVIGDGTVTSAIDTINNNLYKLNYKDAISLTSDNFPYTIPSNGILILEITPSSGNVAVLRIYNGTVNFIISAYGSTVNGQYWVNKGEILSITVSENLATYVIKFIPFTY